MDLICNEQQRAVEYLQRLYSAQESAIQCKQLLQKIIETLPNIWQGPSADAFDEKLQLLLQQTGKAAEQLAIAAECIEATEIC